MAFRHDLISGKAAFADLASRESHCRQRPPRGCARHPVLSSDCSRCGIETRPIWRVTLRLLSDEALQNHAVHLQCALLALLQ